MTHGSSSASRERRVQLPRILDPFAIEPGVEIPDDVRRIAMERHGDIRLSDIKARCGGDRICARWPFVLALITPTAIVLGELAFRRLSGIQMAFLFMPPILVAWGWVVVCAMHLKRPRVRAAARSAGLDVCVRCGHPMQSTPERATCPECGLDHAGLPLDATWWRRGGAADDLRESAG